MIKPKKIEFKINQKHVIIFPKKLKHILKINKQVLKKKKFFQIKRIHFLLDIKTYRGVRLKKGLPARGQRTRTNAVSCKKKNYNAKKTKKKNT